jgi:hypothetical protein
MQYHFERPLLGSAEYKSQFDELYLKRFTKIEIVFLTW